MTRKRRAVLALLVGLVMLVAVPAAANATTLIQGQAVPTPSQECPFYPGNSQEAIAGTSQIGYVGDPDPVVGQVYYVELSYEVSSEYQIDNANGTIDCDPYEDVQMEIGLPEDTAPAISAQNPIVCYENQTQITNGACPTNYEAPISGGPSGPYYTIDPPGSTPQVWSMVPYGDTITVALPVVSTSASAATSVDESCPTFGSGSGMPCASGITAEYDGNCAGCEPVGRTEVGITVEDATVTPATVGYQASPTSNLTDDSVTFDYTVSPNGNAGTSYVEYDVAGAGGICPGSGSPTDTSGATFSAGTTGTSNESASASSLGAETLYCWRAVFDPSSGSAVDGAWSQFATLPAGTPPTVGSVTASAITMTGATLTYTAAPNSNIGASYVEYVPAGSGGACPGAGSPLNTLGAQWTATNDTDGRTTEVPTASSLSAGTTYCAQAVFSYDGGSNFAYGGWSTFTTAAPAGAPSITSPTTTGVGFSQATFNYSLNPENQAGNTYVEFGQAGAGNTCPPSTSQDTGSTTVASGTSTAIAETQMTTGLSIGTTYCWRADFTETGGTTVYGAWNTFETAYLMQVPTIGYQSPATTQTATSVTVSYVFHPANKTLSSWLEVGTPSAGSCSSPTGVMDSNLVAFTPPDGGAVDETGTITGLTPLTQYCVAATFTGVTSPAWQLVTTSGFLSLLQGITYPSAATTAITATGATLNYDVLTDGATGTSVVQLGADLSSGACTSLSGVQAVGSPVSFARGSTGTQAETATASGLAASTAYCWRAVFTPSGDPADNGAWQPFTTIAASTSPPGGGGTTNPGGNSSPSGGSTPSTGASSSSTGTGSNTSGNKTPAGTPGSSSSRLAAAIAKCDKLKGKKRTSCVAAAKKRFKKKPKKTKKKKRRK